MRAAVNPYVANMLFFDNNRTNRGSKIVGSADFSELGAGDNAYSSGFSAQSAAFIPQSAGAKSFLMQDEPEQKPIFSNCIGFHFKSDKDLIERVRQAFGITDFDNVQIMVIPKGQGGRRGLQTGSFTFRPTTSRLTGQLNVSINRLQRRIMQAQHGNLNKNQANNSSAAAGQELHGLAHPDASGTRNETARERERERAEEVKAERELRQLRRRLEVYRRQLQRERQRLANAPLRGFIVVEREE